MNMAAKKTHKDMYAMGYDIPYWELHQFCTSAAAYFTTDREPLPSGTLIPLELIPK